MKIKALLFDLDGTLLDTLEDIAQAMNRVLARQGYPTHPLQAYRYLVGRGIKNLVLSALPPQAAGDTARVELCLKDMAQEYVLQGEKCTRPYPGITDMLDGLAVRGCRLAVLSNKPDALTRAVVSHHLGRWQFDVVRGARDDTPVKPHPRGAEEILSALRLHKNEVLYLGDTNTDMETARAAGLTAVGVEWGFRDRQELMEAGAHYIIAQPQEIFAVIDQIEEGRDAD